MVAEFGDEGSKKFRIASRMDEVVLGNAA